MPRQIGSRPLVGDVQLRLFRRDDWDWIARWFQDEWLNRALGPMDRDWLDHVLQDRRGVQLVAMQNIRFIRLRILQLTLRKGGRAGGVRLCQRQCCGMATLPYGLGSPMLTPRMPPPGRCC